MKQDNRVLGRIGARELTTLEVAQVTGGLRIQTTTRCTLTPSGQLLGDVNECGGI